MPMATRRPWRALQWRNHQWAPSGSFAAFVLSRSPTERERGNSFRDMGLFQDDDGTAYVLYSSESNASLYVVRLSDYTDIVRPGNPFSGPDAATSNHSQSTFVLPLPSACSSCFVYMGDRWDGQALKKSTYVWLPFVVTPAGMIDIPPRTEWRLKDYQRLRREAASYELVWADEFDRDGRPDSTNWTYERGAWARRVAGRPAARSM